ncbi:site-specific tyrosine recombinase XerS (plasmid) [Alkalihalophilus pseudofirmus OF4]|uniref:Site-specific tyrosine recombinase XerS n=1 Tax=Alkalihalophilus pseudofirmus (strain ATCC BAA-2126 / JCM 17055 / OF4) TaxID=398511 RepID=D3G102_ALKPO|nr:tyrosine recombinase XerS [Alkalihalophilus pseudofirmus]ADC52028.1 site-specific tyrosine recombinase XerS [Alkalihalophilus pseudofirmus OF4]
MAINSQQQNHYIKMQQLLKDLPWYVGEFIDHRRRKLSSSSLMNYCHDFKIFFNWIISESIYQGNIKEVPLEIMEKLTVQQMESFLGFLEYVLENKEITVNRKLSALKSLFNYLQNIAETPDLNPYISRNVMTKIDFNVMKDSIETTANKMEGKILMGDEYEAFRQFISHDYGQINKNNKKIFNFHILNKERDTAIISLILGSGLRLSEVVNLDLADIDFNKFTARAIRKGNKEQFVYFSKLAMDDLQEYLTVRTERYKVEKGVKALFVSAPMGPKGTSRRLSARAIEKMVEKYALAYGKPSLSVHKLRHSFATRYHREINDVPKLRRQLGHSSIQTTMIYTHIKNDDLKNAVDNMDIPKTEI